MGSDHQRPQDKGNGCWELPKVNNNNDSNHLTVEEHNLEFVNSFKYLGSIVYQIMDQLKKLSKRG